MKDSMFFICEGEVGMKITVVTDLGPGQVMRWFDLNLSAVAVVRRPIHFESPRLTYDPG